MMVIIAGGWDYLLYFSPLKSRMSAYKFNKNYPSKDQFLRDIFWTTSATLLAAVQEVLLMWYWAGGHFKAAWFGKAPENETFVPYDQPFFAHTADNATVVFSVPLPGIGMEVKFHEYTLGFLLWTVTMYYWRICHFWFVHRGMHPWWDRRNGLKDVRRPYIGWYGNTKKRN